ncbi:MAG: hypothetical protein IJ123_05965 [Blautia sp.]|nr:hypothetical protein [Blautia sp.]
MSIRENIHYEMYLAGDVTPEWIKGERYEYCEDFYGSIARKGREHFRRFVNQLRMFLF